MRRIKNIPDLEFEKLKLKVQQLELEKRMDHSWKQIMQKLAFDDAKHEKQLVSKEINFKTGNSLLNGALNYGASFLSHKLGLLAGKKIEGLAEQALETLSGKLNTAVSKKKRA